MRFDSDGGLTKEAARLDCVWAVGAAGSRPFWTHEDLSFVPMFDLINKVDAVGAKPTVGINTGDNEVGLICLNDITPGEELLIEYGILPLGTATARWGFAAAVDPLVLASNPHWLEAAVAPQDAYFSNRGALSFPPRETVRRNRAEELAAAAASREAWEGKNLFSMRAGQVREIVLRAGSEGAWQDEKDMYRAATVSPESPTYPKHIPHVRS